MSVRGFASVDALLAVGRRTPAASSTLVGLALGLQARTAYGDDCIIVPSLGPGCLRDFPNLSSAAVVAGHTAFVVSLRGALLPNFNGDSYRLLALGIGVRLQ